MFFFENSGGFEICYCFAPEVYRKWPFTRKLGGIWNFLFFPPSFRSKFNFLENSGANISGCINLWITCYFETQPEIQTVFCTLGTSLPNPTSNPSKIRLYLVSSKDNCVQLGHGKTFRQKKLGLVQEKKSSWRTQLFLPQP